MPGADAEQKFVIFAAAERISQIIAEDSAIRGRNRDSRRIDFRADAASLEDVAEVLKQAVADVDRGGRGTEAGEALAREEARIGADETLDQKFFCGAYLFVFARARMRALSLPASSRHPTRGITERAGNEDVIAGARRIATHDAPARFAQQRNRDRELPRTGDIATHDVGGSRTRRGSQAGIDLIEHPRRDSTADREIHDAGGRSPAHRGDVAQVDRERARAKSFERDPSKVEVNAFDK